MKAYKFTFALLILASLSSISFAEEPQKNQAAMPPMKGMGMHQGMGMMGGMTDEQKNEHMRIMQEHMLSIHDLSNQILAEKDPAKKEALKVQQLELMKTQRAQMMEQFHQKMMEQKK